tara:strand:- start:1319 stop:2380 length:1062 start_codon:yes stop_codon:yes gene_type:complete
VTYNQLGSSTGLDRLDQTPGTDAAAVYRQILFMTTAQAQAAFDAASGEVYASLLANGLDEAMTRTDRLIARAHESSAEGWGLWGGVIGRDASVDSDGNAAETESDGYGFDVGIDYRGPDNRWALGAVVGYFDGGLDVDARRSTVNYDGWHIGAYGRYGSGNTGLTATGAINYGDSEANVRRRIAFGTLSRDARATVDMQTFALEGELRYGLPAGNGWALGPMTSFFYADADLGRFAETGANSLNLTSSGASDEVSRFGGGLFANWQGAHGSIDASAQYVDGHGNAAQIGMTLAGAPGTSFSVRSPQTGGSAGLFSLAGRYELGGGWSIGGDIRGLIGDEVQAVSGSATIGWRF